MIKLIFSMCLGAIFMLCATHELDVSDRESLLWPIDDHSDSYTALPFDPQTFKNPLWDERIELSSVLQIMREGILVYSCPMREYLEKKQKIAKFQNEVHFGILRYDDNYLAVVLKPKRGEVVSSVYAEMIAYDIYESVIAPYTGNHFIPPTVIRKLSDGQLASCQYFVETADDEDMWNSQFRETFFNNIHHETIQELAVFNAVFNDWDRHPGNYLATFYDGSYRLASIDNESIENRGIITEWGMRSYIPCLFTYDPRAQQDEEAFFDKKLSLEDFKKFLVDHGFKETPKMTIIFNNLFDRGEGQFSCYISNGCLLVPYHKGNNAAFPLPKAPYCSTLITTYRQLDRDELDRCFRPLVELDPRFKDRVSEILYRRDMFLNSLNSNDF